MEPELSVVQIHVERVIGLLKQKFTISQSTLTITFVSANNGDDSLSIADKIVFRLLHFGEFVSSHD